MGLKNAAPLLACCEGSGLGGSRSAAWPRDASIVRRALVVGHDFRPLSLAWLWALVDFTDRWVLALAAAVARIVAKLP